MKHNIMISRTNGLLSRLRRSWMSLIAGRDVTRNLKGGSRWANLGRIREFILGSNQVLQSKVEGEARNEGANQMIIYEGVVRTKEMSGERLTEPHPRNFLKNLTWNHSFWYIFETNIWNKMTTCMIRDHDQLPTFMKRSTLNIRCLEIV